MSDQSDIAADLLVDGQPMTLTRVTPGVIDAVAGSVGTPITETWAVYGITGSYRSSSVNLPGSLIQAGDKKATIAAGTVAPAPGDTLTIMGVVWTVIMVDELSPQGESLLYTCQARR